MKPGKKILFKYLQSAAEPLQDILRNFYDLHCSAIVTQDGVTIVRDEIHAPVSTPSEAVSLEDLEPRRKTTTTKQFKK